MTKQKMEKQLAAAKIILSAMIIMNYDALWSTKIKREVKKFLKETKDINGKL